MTNNLKIALQLGYKDIKNKTATLLEPLFFLINID